MTVGESQTQVVEWKDLNWKMEGRAAKYDEAECAIEDGIPLTLSPRVSKCGGAAFILMPQQNKRSGAYDAEADAR